MTTQFSDGDLVWVDEGFFETRVDSPNLERLSSETTLLVRETAKSNCKACRGRGKIILQTPSPGFRQFIRGMIPRERELVCDCVTRRLSGEKHSRG